MKQILHENQNESFYITLKESDNLKKIEEIIKYFYFELDKKIIFIDEIQNAKDWGNWVIDMYNDCSGLTFIISGSASIKVSDTSGSIRFREVEMGPLEIDEYIALHNDSAKGKALLNNYLGINSIIGFLHQSISWNEAKSYYFDTYIYKDIIKYENGIRVSDLEEFIEIFKHNTSGEINKNNIIKKIWGVYNSTNNRKLDHIIGVLIKYKVLFILKRKNLDGSINRNKKYYMNPHLFLILHENSFEKIPQEFIGNITEALILYYKFKNQQVYYIKQNNNSKRYPSQEIDIVLKNTWYEIKASYKKENIIEQLNRMFLNYNQKDLQKIILSFTEEKSIKNIKNINIIDFLLN